MGINTIKGDVFSEKMLNSDTAFLHFTNCFNEMEVGVAKGVKHYLPELYQADQLSTKGAMEKLGSYSTAQIDMGLDKEPVTGFNVYCQYQPGGAIDINALVHALNLIAKEQDVLKVMIPKNQNKLIEEQWYQIERMLGAYFPVKVTVVKYK